MKYYTYLFGVFLIALFSSFTNVENSTNNDNTNCQPIENLYAALDNNTNSLLLKWDDVAVDVTYFVSINGLTFHGVTSPYIVIPSSPQFSFEGINIQIRKSCQSGESMNFKGSLVMQCDGGLGMELEMPYNLKPESDDGGCCIIATSGNINVHGPCSGEAN